MSPLCPEPESINISSELLICQSFVSPLSCVFRRISRTNSLEIFSNLRWWDCPLSLSPPGSRPRARTRATCSASAGRRTISASSRRAAPTRPSCSGAWCAATAARRAARPAAPRLRFERCRFFGAHTDFGADFSVQIFWNIFLAQIFAADFLLRSRCLSLVPSNSMFTERRE